MICKGRALVAFGLCAFFMCAINLHTLRYYTVSSASAFVTHDDVQDVPSAKTRLREATDKSSTAETSSFDKESFKARRDTVPSSLYGKISHPYINLGFPKAGELRATAWTRPRVTQCPIAN